MAEKDPVRSEKNRLTRIFKDLPPNQLAVVRGLIDQAARLRIMQDELWADIEKNGRTELFAQSADAVPYDRERPAVKQFQTAAKNYQAAIKQLVELAPPSQRKSKLKALLDDG